MSQESWQPSWNIRNSSIDGITGSFSISRSSDLILWVANVAEPGPEQLQPPQLRAAPVDTRHDGSVTSYPDAPSLNLDSPDHLSSWKTVVARYPSILPNEKLHHLRLNNLLPVERLLPLQELPNSL